MPNIATTDAQALFTKKIVDVYEQRPKPTAFLRSFFPNEVAPTKELSIEVVRMGEKVAVDVVRATEKIFIPPYYREWFDATQLQLYDRLYGATEINDRVFAAYLNSVVDRQMDLQAKIERAYELQCAQVLETGIVTIEAGTNIDYKRKAASLVDDGAGQYFANNIDPFQKFENGCTFLRTVGKAEGSVFNAILGSTALSDLYNNTKFKERQNLFNMVLDAVAPPQRNSVGASYHGEITCGAYRVRLWSYPQYYDVNNTSTPYVNPKKVTLIPETPRFKMGFAAVPQLITPDQPPRIGSFIFSDYIDQRGRAHIFEVESAGLAIPSAIDQLYTFKAVA
jgi:hypothetical protein